MKKNSFKSIIGLIIFGIAFGFVEAAVVYYLRTIFGLGTNFAPVGNYKVILNLGVITFLSSGSIILPNARVLHAEVLREIATIIMLIAVSYVSAEKIRQRVGAFLITFSMWDIFYYVFLYFLTGWPRSLMDTDVYFLNPVPWVGPVATAVMASTILFIVGSRMYLKKS